MALSPEDLLIFKARGAQKKKEEQPAAKAEAKPQPEAMIEIKPPQAEPAPKPEEPRVEAPTPQPAFEAEAVPLFEEAPPEEPVVPKAHAEPATKKEAESRESAKGEFCAWHAWRPAYAVCDYCHRPFCYEDMEEFNNGYYCLEDIDKVSATHAESVYTSYTNMSFISAAMLMLSFATFIFFANAQLAYVLNYAHTLGMAFLGHLNFSYGSLLLEAFLVLMSLAAAIMIMVQAKRAFALGMAAGVGNVALFSYLYLGSGTLYIAAIAVASFVGLVTLAYSRVTYAAYAETPFVESGPVAIPGPQKF